LKSHFQVGTCRSSHDAGAVWLPGGDVKATRWSPHAAGVGAGDPGGMGGRWLEPRTVYPQSADGGLPKVSSVAPTAVAPFRVW
jgi:hypothetical protein